MITDYKSAVSFLNSRIRFGLKSGLGNISKLTKALDCPQNSFPAVHVAGTNGKGSTSLYLASMLSHTHKKVGLFTSPHLLSFRERMRILSNDELEISSEVISEAEVVKFLQEIQICSEKIKVSPTFFETLLALALLYFRDHHVDLVVLEVGLGGRLDATNEVDGEMALIPSIGLDHTDILGDTLEKILYEKMGVSRAGKPLFLGKMPDFLVDAAIEYAHKYQCQVHQYPSDIEEFTSSLNLKNQAKHYSENASLAYTAALEYLKINQKKSIEAMAELSLKFKQTLENVSWPGRMHKISNNQFADSFWILDGAHNEPAIKGLVESIKEKYPKTKFKLLLGISADKDITNMLNILTPLASEIHLAEAKSPRLQKIDELQRDIELIDTNIKIVRYPSVKNACLDLWNSDSKVLVCGSLYFVGEIICELRLKAAELSWFQQFDPEENEFG